MDKMTEAEKYQDIDQLLETLEIKVQPNGFFNIEEFLGKLADFMKLVEMHLPDGFTRADQADMLAGLQRIHLRTTLMQLVAG